MLGTLILTLSALSLAQAENWNVVKSLARGDRYVDHDNMISCYKGKWFVTLHEETAEDARVKLNGCNACLYVSYESDVLRSPSSSTGNGWANDFIRGYAATKDYIVQDGINCGTVDTIPVPPVLHPNPREEEEELRRRSNGTWRRTFPVWTQWESMREIAFTDRYRKDSCIETRRRLVSADGGDVGAHEQVRRECLCHTDDCNEDEDSIDDSGSTCYVCDNCNAIESYTESNCDKCFKATIYEIKTGGISNEVNEVTTRAIKRCLRYSEDDVISYKSSGCRTYRTANNNQDVIACHCSGDLCNGATKSTSVLGILFASLVCFAAVNSIKEL